jgi:hypothetical protein
MEYRLKSTGQVMYEGELRQYLKDNNGPTFGQMTTEIMDDIGVDPVFEGPQPSTSGPYEYVARQGVEMIGDKWHTKYVVQTLDDEGKAAKDEETKKSVRADRNQRLADTDWRFRSDMTPSQAWKDYCQALRDVPAQAGFPHNVQWPNKPE